MVTLYSKPRSIRLPLKLQWLLRYVELLNVNNSNWQLVELDVLSEIFLLLLTFFYISRPPELLFSDDAESSEWDVITTGLNCGDIIMHNAH